MTILLYIHVYTLLNYCGLNESTKFFLQQHQHSDNNQEILTLRQHIQILQQEHLSKISRIAELEAQLQSLKVTKTDNNPQLLYIIKSIITLL